MVRLNGSNFKIFDLDTNDTVKERVASTLNTLPRYLYLPEGDDARNDIVAIDLLEIIKEDAKKNVSFPGLMRVITEKIAGPLDEKMPEIGILTDIIFIWLAYNTAIETFEMQGFDGKYFALLSIQGDISAMGITDANDKEFNPERFYETDRPKVRKALETAIASNKKAVRTTLAMFKDYETIDVGLPVTEFELESVGFDFTLSAHTTLLEMFNSIRLNLSAPIASIASFFKILKSYSPEETFDSREDEIRLRITSKRDLENLNEDDYSIATVQTVDEQIQSSLDLKIDDKNLDKDEFIQRFLNVFVDVDPEIESIVDNKITGVFYIPDHRFDKFVMADMVMNNPLFSSLMSVNESVKPSTKKTHLRVHFYHMSTGIITINITDKIMTKNDQDMKDKDLSIFPLNEHYIRVKVSHAESIEAINTFRHMFNKLLLIYDKEYQTIVDIYRQFIPTFGVHVDKKVVERKVALKDIVPDLFVPNYTRSCRTAPTIIDDDQVEEAKANGQEVMRFPKDGDGPAENQHNYVCNYDEEKYPGLRDNPLSNSNVYPMIPCCYAKDQSVMRGSKYRYYFYDEEMTGKDSGQQNFITTKKFATNRVGRLPKTLVQTFQVADNDVNSDFIRKGVSIRNKSSFLYCVMEALNEQTGILDANDDAKEIILAETRHEMATPTMAALCRQEAYDMDIDAVMSTIANPEEYFDPKIFIRLLEVKYNCHIYLFSRSENSEGEMIIPRHVHGYYRSKSDDGQPSIFIFEHMGSESDQARYPQCELIIKWNTKTRESMYTFDYDSVISVFIRSVYNNLLKTYALDELIVDSDFDWKDVSIISQGIDAYGKTRKLDLEHDGELFTMFTSPIQPLQVIENTNIVDYASVSVDLALELFEYLDIEVAAQTVINDDLEEISGVFGNVTVYIPISSGEPLAKVRRKLEPHYPIEDTSILKKYNRNKKMARYLVEYMLYLFSHFMSEEGLDGGAIHDRDLVAFSRKYMHMDSDFDYGHVSKIFSMESGVMRDGKLVITSIEMKKRLLFVLRRAILQTMSDIIAYKDKIVMDRYYIDVSDFDVYSHQVILEGDLSVEKWINERRLRYNLHTSVFVKTMFPYFFRNENIDGYVYLAQNTDSIGKAITIANTWNADGYNAGKHAVASKMEPMTLYAFTNRNDIVRYDFMGGNDDVTILGYKVEGVARYTTLMSLKEG